MTLLLDVSPPTTPLTAFTPVLSTVAWRGYRRDDARQPWSDAIAESIATHTTRTGHTPTLALVSGRETNPALPTALQAAGLAVIHRAAVTVQPGTWGLA